MQICCKTPNHATRRGTAGTTGCGNERRAGAVTVEFSLVLPIVFFLFLGSLELTAVNIIRHSASNAAYEAARKMVIPGGTEAAARAEAIRLLQITKCSNGATVTVDSSGRQVRVTVSVPAASNSWGLSRFIGGLTVRQTAVLSKEEAN
ncbi:MAG: pilus assembly protein [Planctomycetaceae bacterium]|nr:pilus assembly protein [Planctomycetaceae bacterium]